MLEVGIDLRGRVPCLLTPEMETSIDLLVTMGCGEVCPVVPDARRVEWSLDDPKGRSRAEVGTIRDEIADKVGDLLDQRGWRVG